MRELYNEGRVVGLSSYELYVRQVLSEDSEANVLTEREWIAATVSSGSSMILKVASGTPAGYADYVLPSDSDLCGCSTIYASVFDGNVVMDSANTWAVSVSDYGQLISNTAELHPSTPGNPINVPTKPISTSGPIDIDATFEKQCIEYTKIISGRMFQPGIWSEDLAPAGTAVGLKPDLSANGFIRLRIASEITADFYILITGFEFKQVSAGATGFDTPMEMNKPSDGDFLGPIAFPWAVPIVITLPNEVYNVIERKGLVRKLPADADPASVHTKAVIDFEATEPGTYYAGNHSDSNVSINFTDVNSASGVSALNLYQRPDTYSSYSGADYPPVLYGSKITSTGMQNISPIDTAAPGTFKLFTSGDKAKGYSNIYPNVYGAYINASNHIKLYTQSGQSINLSSSVSVTSSDNKLTGTVTSGDDTMKTLALQHPDGTAVDTSGASGSVEGYLDTFMIDYLLQALDGDKKIDLKGTTRNYLEFNGKRLYISATSPGTTGIPDGSIGIGW